MKFSEALRNLGQPIAYYPQLAKPLGGVTAAILFGQLFFWQDKTDNPLGVYKTQADLERETGLTRREQETARRLLREIGVLIETHKRLEHRIYFKLDLAKFDALMAVVFSAETPASADGGNEPPPMAENAIRDVANPPFVNTEITTENTTEITIKKTTQKKPAKFEPESVLLPDFVNRADWVAYCEMRKAKGRNAEIKTERTVQLALADLVDLSGGDATKASAILNQSIKNTWTGLFALKVDYHAQANKSKPKLPDPHSGFDERVYGETVLPSWALDVEGGDNANASA